jgi:hypothetical protein
MPFYLKKLFAKLQEEDFCYSTEIKRADGFLDEMCHHYPAIHHIILHLQTEWEASKTAQEEISTYVINRPDTAGIVIKIGEPSQDKILHYVIDYIKCQLQNDGYLVQVNKHTAQRENASMHETWNYFLKPKPTFSEDKQVQRYGNVVIELKKDAKNALQFKLQCNYYSGFQYEPPVAFCEFLARL